MKKTLLLLLAASSFSIAALSCGSTTLGNPCEVDRDCEGGQTCFLNGFPGGVCTRGCSREGELGRECPGNSVCVRATTTSSTLFCSNACTDDSQCRGGAYLCRATAGGTVKACAP